MNYIRRSLLVIGVVSCLIGLLLITSPTLATVVELTGTVRALPFVLIGLVALILGARYALTGVPSHATETVRERATDYPSPADRPPYARPGTRFTRQLAEITWTNRREEKPESRLALRSELHEIAITVLSQTDNWTRAECETRLNDGSWTDDPQAAAFFTDDVVPSLSIQHHLRSLRTTEPPFARRARHAIAELASRYNGTDASPALFESTRGDPTPIVTTRRYWAPYEPETTRVSRSERTQWVTAAALIAGGLGIVTLQPSLLLLALLGITVAGYARVATPPSRAVEVTRTLGTSEPDPGQHIDVTVSVRNSSETTITDLRVIDGVPAGLTVSEGSPRFTTALRPGKEATFTYSVRAVSGSHEFDPLLCITRDVIGVHKRETLVDGGSSAVTCLPTETPELKRQRRPQTTVHPGQTQSTVEGSGIEFHSVRDYRPGDPRSRINWKRTAKTGELTTIDFQESRLATVMVVIDARADAYLTPLDGDRPIVQQSLSAARYLMAQLVSERVPVGLAALSPRSCWLPPNTGASHRIRVRNALATDPAFSWDRPEADVEVSVAVKEFCQRMRYDTQILFVSPLCDDGAKRVAQRFNAYGTAVTVISPDPTAASTPDCALGYASLTRRFRLGHLHSADIPVLDWHPKQPFEEVFNREP